MSENRNKEKSTHDHIEKVVSKTPTETEDDQTPKRTINVTGFIQRQIQSTKFLGTPSPGAQGRVS